MIVIPKICGTCNGAENALNVVYNLYEREKTKNNPKRIVIYKEILHNKRVIEDLRKKNIVCVENLDEIKSNDVVVIRAHGEGKKTYDYLKKNNIEFYDATCKNVLRIHDIIKEKYYQKYEIIIIGKVLKDGNLHPEVEGSNGWCQEKAHIIDNIEQVEQLDITEDNVLIICQTTFGIEEAEKIAQKIKDKFRNKNIEYINSICNAQKLIQKYSKEVAKKCDYMLVIGGKNSSNTNELFNSCSQICKCIRISNYSDLFEWLNTVKINDKTKIGITGGASTPKKEIEEYRQLLEFFVFYKNEKNKFEKAIKKYNNSFRNKEDDEIVNKAVEKFININCGGKYIRAMLISLGYKLASGKYDDYYLSLAMAYETFQTAILIHDDIIDNAQKRRGKETIPETYKKEFNNNGKDVANSLGLCIGDLGFYFANEIIIKKYHKDPNLSKIIEYYNKIVINTIKGEIIDVKLPYDVQYNQKESNEESIMEIYKLKTAWYTITGPFCLGCILGGTTKSRIKVYEKILTNIGIAFQIKDDIIGIYGDSNYIGKSTNSDISEFKQTILYSYIYNYNKKYLKELNKYYGKKDLNDKEISRVKEIFIESNALEYANKKMEQLFDESIQKIAELNINEKYKNIFIGFINYLKIRKK